jgi:glucose-6-phosphate isomerase
MNWTNFDKLRVYGKLQEAASGQVKGLESRRLDFSGLDEKRVGERSVALGGGLTYNYAAKAVDAAVLALLQELASEAELIAKYKALLDGEVINTGEKRRVLHHLLRGQLGKSVVDTAAGSRDIGKFYASELERGTAFADKVHRGLVKSSAGKAFTHAVQIGIGGSDLGPRALYLALRNWAAKEGKEKLAAAFISNVDPDDASAVCASVPLESTVFILVSKSGTTQETLANELFVKEKLKSAGLDPSKQMLAVTSETSPLAKNPAYLDSFYFDDYIGGRYSSSAAVGGVILSLAFGGDVFRAFLDGAHEADKAALEPDILKNAALLDALLGVWEVNFLDLPYTAILPYSQALSRFPAHLQQLDMESNGKSVNRNAEPVAYRTGPVVFGEPGTNGQHSFYQLLHQGTHIVPLQFVGFEASQLGDDVEVDGSVSQKKLRANLAAQIVAFAKGQASPRNLNKDFAGGRPSSLIHGKRLTPAALGALLAHFENKVMFQGFVWNINSFDQEGVQLGKVLTKKVLSGESDDGALNAYSRLLGLR